MLSKQELREQQLREAQRQGQLHGWRFARSSWIAIAAGASLFFSVSGGLAAWASRQHQAEKQALEREIASRSEQGRVAQLTFDAQIRALARTAKEQARILDDLQHRKPAVEPDRPRPPRRTAPSMQPTAAPSKPQVRVPKKTEIVDDPLAGLPDINSGSF